MHARWFPCLAASLRPLKGDFISFSGWSSRPWSQRGIFCQSWRQVCEAQIRPYFCVYFWLDFILALGKSSTTRWCLATFEMKCQLFWRMYISVPERREKSSRETRPHTLQLPAGGVPEVISVALCGWGPRETTEAATNRIDLSRRSSLWPFWSRALWRRMPRMESHQNARGSCKAAIILFKRLPTKSRVQLLTLLSCL